MNAVDSLQQAAKLIEEGNQAEARTLLSEVLASLNDSTPAPAPIPERGPLSPEAEAARVSLLNLLGTLQADAQAERLQGVYWSIQGLQQKHGPQLQRLFESLPTSADPHIDAAQAADIARRIAGGFKGSEMLEDQVVQLAELTAPAPPHARCVVHVPTVRCVVEPDPPVAWETRVQVQGAWYGGGTLWWIRQQPPSEANPIEGSGWQACEDSGTRDEPELLPVQFPLPLRRYDLRHWRGWVPAPTAEEGRSRGN